MGAKHVIRDVDANEDVQELVENGYFAEEISLYGCAYVLDHRIYFRIHDNEAVIRNFVRREEEAGKIFPTLVDMFYSREKIPAGMREKKKEEARARMVARMKEEYPRAFFRALMLMAECPANNSAEACLKQWMQSLFCCFDSLEIQLFEGSLKACRQGKLLEAENYKMMERWCEDRWLQINQQNRARGAYSRQFSGFAYFAQGAWQIFCDANELVVWRHYEQALKDRLMVTPVVRKRFETDKLGIGVIEKLEEQFLAQLDAAMSDTYFFTIQYLHALPSAIPEDLISRQREVVAKLNSIRAKESFNYWLTKWNCFK